MERKSKEEKTYSTLDRKQKAVRWTGGIVGGIFAIVLVLGVFIHVDPAAAAQFTDNVLRPILGPTRVVALESMFYNASDKIQQLQYKYKKPSSPLISGGGAILQSTTVKPVSTDLDLAQLPTSYFTPVSGEGVWTNKPLTLFPTQQAIAYTLLRPDSSRSYAFVTVAELNMHLLHLSAVAGTQQPGGPINMPGPGTIPASIISSGNLVSAFDGGFQYRDGQYGMVVGSTTYVPLEQNIATLVGYTDGTLKLVKYSDQNFGPNVEFIRQNCPMLIDNESIGTTDESNKALWGRTPTTSIYTWRSGLGITADGNLLYAVGNNLTPTTLAYALKSAGAVNAMQLDINPFWVRFNVFNEQPGGGYSTSTIMKGIEDGSKDYLSSYIKDFFYVYKK